MKVLIGLSGGVDSAVAAYLLKEQGYEVVGGFMKNYSSDNAICTTYQDAEEAIKVADFLGIELISFDFQKEYQEKIIDYIYEGYQRGVTPNPDVLCNSLIKFDLFLEHALKLGFDKIATGHYARIQEIDESQSPLGRGSRGGSKKYLHYDSSLKEKVKDLRRNQTAAEKKIWYDFLSTHQYKFLRQKPLGKYIVDFFSHALGLVIEIDGNTHSSDHAVMYDKERTDYLKSIGFQVMRFSNQEVFDDFYSVCERIELFITSTIKTSPPPPSKEGGLYQFLHEKKSQDTSEEGQFYQLLRGKDHHKDQSYFLAGLNQFQLSHALFPLGELDKAAVRDLAQKIGLPNADRKDSQGLCFIGNIPIKTFLQQQLPIKKGPIKTLEGKIVGEHEGAYFFTIGQKHGLGLNFKAYVYRIDVKENIVYVSEREAEELYSDELMLKDWHWIGKSYPNDTPLTGKIRYRQNPPVACSIVDQEGDQMKISFVERQRAVAPGQTFVLYDGEICLGSGIIV